MKPGDLVRFKHPGYHKSYGFGVMLGKLRSSRLDSRYWALFNGERLMARLDELELVSESR